jgi:hypothetical protein
MIKHTVKIFLGILTMQPRDRAFQNMFLEISFDKMPFWKSKISTMKVPKHPTWQLPSLHCECHNSQPQKFGQKEISDTSKSFADFPKRQSLPSFGTLINFDLVSVFPWSSTNRVANFISSWGRSVNISLMSIEKAKNCVSSRNFQRTGLSTERWGMPYFYDNDPETELA